MNITYETPVGTPDRSFDRRPAQRDAVFTATDVRASMASMITHAARGHHADGSSIQNHSCGSHYPYVVGARETKYGLRWFVMAPDGAQATGMSSAVEAIEMAEDLAVRHRARLTPPERRTPWN